MKNIRIQSVDSYILMTLIDSIMKDAEQLKRAGMLKNVYDEIENKIKEFCDIYNEKRNYFSWDEFEKPYIEGLLRGVKYYPVI